MEHDGILFFAKVYRKKGKKYSPISFCTNGRDQMRIGDIVSFYLGDGIEVEGKIEYMEGPKFDDINVIISDEDGLPWLMEPAELNLIKSKREE